MYWQAIHCVSDMKDAQSQIMLTNLDYSSLPRHQRVFTNHACYVLLLKLLKGRKNVV